MLEILFKVLGAGLSIWESKEKTKYIDQLIELKKDFYEEFNKGAGHRSNAVLDNIEREMLIIAEVFASNAGSKNS